MKHSSSPSPTLLRHVQLRRTCERGQNTAWGFGAVKVFWMATLDGEDNSSLSVPHIVHPHRRSGGALPTRVLPCRGYMCSLSVHLSREHVSSAALWQQPAQVRPLQDSKMFRGTRTTKEAPSPQTIINRGCVAARQDSARRVHVRLNIF